MLFAINKDSLQEVHYQQAFENMNQLLTDSNNLSFEDAIFEIENAYYDNALSYEAYKNKLNFHTNRILLLAEVNKEKLNTINVSQHWSGISSASEKEQEESNNKVLLNWAIYTYLTDTTYWKQADGSYAPQYPMQYDTDDPFGAENWENTLVTTLLDSKIQKGNCYSMAALYYIFSLRLQTEAYLTTAPYHIFIQHKGFDGNFYNIELTTKTFPGSGTIKTYTYSSHEAVKNGISMRRLSEKEAVALCFVQLAKGYEKKLSIKNVELRIEKFELACAESALLYDSLCLNALVLKAQALERIINNEE